MANTVDFMTFTFMQLHLAESCLAELPVLMCSSL
jgi:hypothetical protein